MRRRSAIKGISALAVGIALFPGCSDGLTIDTTQPNFLSWDSKQGKWLEAISDAILPKAGREFTTLETFPNFVAKMLAFQKTEEEKLAFMNGYNHCTADIKEIFKTAAAKVEPDQIVTYFGDIISGKPKEETVLDEVQILMNKEKKVFCNTLRDLSIWHLTSSKEYQEEVLDYKLVPGTFTADAAV